VTVPLTQALDELQEPLRIHSRALGADLWVVPDPGAELELGQPSYTVSECRLLLAMALSPAQVQAVHRCKAAFQGELVLPVEEAALGRLYRGLLDRYSRVEQELAAWPSGEGEAALRNLGRVIGRVLGRLDELEAEARELP
jgi:hypothetical protein